MKKWEHKSLDEILKKTETVNPLQNPESEFEYIDVSSISNTTFQIEETQRLKGKDAPSRARKLIQTNDVLFATIRPTLRRIAIVPDHLDQQVCSTGYFVLRPKPELNHRFLFYYLQDGDFMEQMEMLQKGASYPAVTDAEVRMQTIPLPPLPEQRRIVAILDEAFAAIDTAKANTQQNLKNTRALFDSHLQSVFSTLGIGWIEDRLASLTTKIGSGATPLGGENAYKSEGISLIRSLNVHDLDFRYERLAFIDDTQAEKLSIVVVHPLDVLLNITGASVARCCVVPEDVLPARVNQHVSIIRAIPEMIDPEFLHFMLISKPYKDKLLQTGEDGGSTRQAITKAQIQEFKVAFPKSVTEQRSIVARLKVIMTETRRLESIYQQKLDALEALKKSLLHDAFRGKLTNHNKQLTTVS
ncbi:MAG: restriction endonuclease subunit S [Planctomycetaceae bacterium]|nr:restriction endonuclease subunit S [Planctomycetaceae bacterium]